MPMTDHTLYTTTSYEFYYPIFCNLRDETMHTLKCTLRCEPRAFAATQHT